MIQAVCYFCENIIDVDETVEYDEGLDCYICAECIEASNDAYEACVEYTRKNPYQL